MWFWLSLIAILFWSGSDLFSKMGSEPDDKYSHWKMVIAVGLIMGLHAAVMLILASFDNISSVVGETMANELPIGFSVSHIITYLPASACYIISMILGYIGLRYLVLSVSTPICNSSGAVACLLFFFIMKESLSPWQIIAIALIVCSVVGLAVFERNQEVNTLRAKGELQKKYTHGWIAIGLPVLYCIIDALGTFIDGFLLIQTDDAGNIISGVIEEAPANIAYELTFFLMAIISAVYVYVIKRQKISKKADIPKLTAGICETAGQLAYIYALGDNAVVAAPLISSYCVFSLLWARIILREKLKIKQYAIIALAVAGIIILGITDA